MFHRSLQVETISKEHVLHTYMCCMKAGRVVVGLAAAGGIIVDVRNIDLARIMRSLALFVITKR